jgi:hypothetical protein
MDFLIARTVNTVILAGAILAGLILHRGVPKNIADIKEAPLPPEFEVGGVAEGVPGGVAGWSQESIPRMRHWRDKHICKERRLSMRLSTNKERHGSEDRVGPTPADRVSAGSSQKMEDEPTYLNDQPLPVQLNLTVTLRLNE